MASTSTNKQPLLVDNVLHEIVDLNGKAVLPGSGVNVGTGPNSAVLVVDGSNGDGCIIESVYALARKKEYTIKLYISTANDYLRPQQGMYIGGFKSSNEGDGKLTEWLEMPRILAPVPHTSNEQQFRALYLPRRKTLWAAVEAENADDNVTEAPLLGVQGGWY